MKHGMRREIPTLSCGHTPKTVAKTGFLRIHERQGREGEERDGD
jgi:hypothetical protein